jgi:conjugation system TraG family ATPase
MKGNNKITDLAKIFPIQSVEDDLLINGNGDITFGYSLFMPEAYMLTQNEFNDIQESMIRMFCKLPPGTLIHKQEFCYLDRYKSDYTDTYQYTKKGHLRYLDQRPVMKHYSNIYFTVSSRQDFNVGGMRNSFTGLLDFVFKKPFRDLENQMKRVKQILIDVETGLNSINKFKAYRLNNDRLLTSLHDIWNLSYMTPSKNVEDKTLLPWEIDNEMKIGDQYVKIISLVEEGLYGLPAQVAKTTAGHMYKNGNKYSNAIRVPTSMTFPLTLGLPVNHIVNTTIEILDYEWLSTYLEIEKRKYNYLATFKYPPAVNKIQQIDFYKEVTSKGDLIPCRTSVNIILHDKDKDRLGDYVSLAGTAFSNMNGSKTWTENFDTANLFVSSTPGNFKTNYRGFISTVTQSVSYFAKESHYRHDPGGNLFSDRFGNPCTLDLWKSPYIEKNRNRLIFGPTGSGKSVWNNTAIDQAVAKGYHVVVLDIGGSYKRNCFMNEGKYFDSNDRKQLSFNIFLCPKDSKGNYTPTLDIKGEKTDDKMNFILAVLIKICADIKVTKAQKEILRNLVENFYEFINREKLFPTMKEFYNFIPTYESLMEEQDKRFIDFRAMQITLKPFADGQYSYLLNSESNIDIKDYQYVVFDLKAIKDTPELRDIVAIIMIELVTDKLAELPLDLPKEFYIDEAIDYLTSGDMAEFIGGMFRKVRKEGGQISIATQDVSFLEHCDPLVRQSIITNCEIKILLDHRSEKSSYKKLMELLSLTEDDIRLLDSIENGPGYKEFFIKINNVSRVFRNELCPETLAVYSTDKDDLAEIDRLMSKYNNMAVAINQFADIKRKKNYEEVY